MLFKFTIKQNPIEISYEADSIDEGIDTVISARASMTRLGAAGFVQPSVTTIEETAATPESAEKAKRHRRTKEQIAADEAAAKAAAAPPPIPVPAPPLASPAPSVPVPQLAGPAPSVLGPENAGGIPAGLVRTAPPPPPPAAPPVQRLCDRIIANLKQRAAASPDSGASLINWLVQSGIATAGATFDEAMAVLQFQTDVQLAPIATALGVV